LIPEQYRYLRRRFCVVGACLDVLSDIISISEGHGPSTGEQVGEFIGEPIGGAFFAWIMWRIWATIRYEQGSTDGAKPSRSLISRLLFAILPAIVIYGGLFALLSRHDSATFENNVTAGRLNSCKASLKDMPVQHLGSTLNDSVASTCDCYCQGIVAKAPPGLLESAKRKSANEMHANKEFMQLIAETMQACLADLANSKPLR
jgi:hypothetical protein